MEPVAQLTVEELPDAVRRAGELALERKAQDVVVLDLAGISSATDHFVIATGTSDIQVKAIADHILDELRGEGQKPNHVEGLETGRWVLMDYVDFVVHVFHPQARDFYQLETLWGDAPRVEMTEGGSAQ
jgi:ribosome-associated protein